MIASRTLLAVALAAGLLAPATADAAVIQGLFNTGVDANGVALAGGNGVADPHYLIVDSTSPGYAGQPAVTYIHPNYWPNDPDSRWISLSATGAPGSNITTYRLTFSLAGLDPATAKIAGDFAVDNVLEIFLNGVGNPVNPGGFQGPTNFNVTAGFVAGVNALDFRISDGGAPTAFRIDNLAGTADVLSTPPDGVPEPATWALMLAGFFGMGGALRSRRRWASALA